MRPDEFSKQMAGRWTRVELIQHSIRKGRAAADEAIQRQAETERRQQESLQKLKEKHG